MKALVYHGPGEKAWETTADPGLQEPTDIVVKVDTTTICGTDLHILKGDVPALAGAGIIVAIDLAPSRLEAARDFGATHGIVSGEGVEEQVLDATDGLGVDVAMEAVGIPATFDLCTRLVRAGGVVANIGVHGAPTTLHLEELWIKNVTITTGLVSGTTVPTLLQLVRSGRLQADRLGTRHFALDQIMEAYDVFAAAGEHDALKVVLRA